MYKVLFVCTANICRTPMAVSQLRHLAEEAKIDHLVKVESIGTYAAAGMPADLSSQEVCAENGLDISSHHSRPVALNLIKNADLVLCMETQHRDDLKSVFPHLADKIFALKEYGHDSPPALLSIVDPHRKNISFYRTAFDEIFQEVKRAWPVIRENILQKCRRNVNEIAS